MLGEKMQITLLLILITLSDMNLVDCTKLKFDAEDRAYLNTNDNLFNSKCETFHINGIKAIENNYINGLLDGNSFMWHSNGELQLKSQYAKGKRIGKFITFYPNGKVESETVYAENEKIESMIKYNDAGEILIKNKRLNDSQD
jgi:antitoxin component YwqK of YwqJK toxin-antitoxin module